MNVDFFRAGTFARTSAPKMPAVKFVFLLLPCFVTSLFGEAPVLQARMISISITQCRRAQSVYEIDIEGKFELTNTSKKTLLVSKTMDMIPTVTAALSPEEAKRRVYFFVMNQEFGGTRSNPAPRLEDFIVLKPGQKGVIDLGAVVPANTDPTYSGRDRLRPGKQWLQFQFFTLPMSFPSDHKGLSS